MFVEKTTAI